jgi:two-component system, NarL family, nitrate/nitrite response regulator NarL
MTTQPITCLVADDSVFFASGLVQELQRSERRFRVVAVTNDWKSTVEQARLCAPEVVIVGFDPQMSMRLAQTLTGHRLLMLTWSRRQDDLVDALRAGFSGFLHKDVTPRRLAETIQELARGRRVYPPGWEDAVISRLIGAGPDGRRGDPVELTARELEVVRLVAQGCSNKELALRLGVAYQTAKNHVHHVMTKVGASSRVQLSWWAMQRGYGPVNRLADAVAMADA